MPGEGVLVACSGGPDSVCLLTILHELSRTWDWRIAVAHVHHGLRPDADDDLDWVAALARKMGLPFFSERVAISGRSEDAARRARYGALAQMAEDSGYGLVALGHHMGDQAETLLMRLVRGAGLRGAAAMATRRGRFVRPLLHETRDVILSALAERGLDTLRDPSNEDDRYLRNWIRGRVIPLLQQRNPRVVQALASFATRQRRDLEALDRALSLLWDRYVTKVDGPGGGCGIRIEMQVLGDLGEGGLWWMLRRAHAQVRAAVTGDDDHGDVHLSAHHLEQVLAVAGVPGEKRASLPAGVSLVTAGSGLVVLPSAWVQPAAIRRWLVPAGEGLAVLEGTGWVLQVGPVAREVARAWPGARLRDGGSLQDHYVDAKVPRILRSHFPILLSNGLVEWAVGNRATEGKLFLLPGSLERALVRLFQPDAGALGIFDLSQPGLSVTTKAREISVGRAIGDDSRSAGPGTGIGSRKA